MIESMLLHLAIAGGRLEFEEKGDHYRLFARMCGMKVSLSTISKEDVKKAMQPQLSVVGNG